MADVETGPLGVGLDVTIRSVADERSAKAAGEKIAGTVAKEVLKTLGDISDFKFGGASSVPTMQAIKVKLAQTAQALTKEQQGLLVDYARVLEETYQELVKIRQAKGKKPRLSGDNEKALELLRGASEDLLNMPLSGTSKDLENLANTVNTTVTSLKQLRTALLRSTPKGADTSVKASVNAVFESFKAIDVLNAQIVKQFDSIANVKIGTYKATTLTQNLGVKMQANAGKLGKTVDKLIDGYARVLGDTAAEQMQTLELIIGRHISEATRARIQEFKVPSETYFADKVRRLTASTGSRFHMDFEFHGNEILSATIGNLSQSTTLINEQFRDIIKNSDSLFLKDKVLPGIEKQLEAGSRGLNTLEVLPAQALAKRIIEEAEIIESMGQTVGTWGMNIAEKPVLQAFTRKHSKEDVQRVEGLFKRKAITDIMDLFGKLTGMTGYKGQSLAEAYMLFFKSQLEGHHTSSEDVTAGSMIDTVMRSPDLLMEAMALSPAQKKDFITYVVKNGLDTLRGSVQGMDLASLAKRYGIKGAAEPDVIINAVLESLNKSMQTLYEGVESGKALTGFGDPRAIERIVARHERRPMDKVDKSIAAATVKMSDAFAHLLDTTAMIIYDAIADNTKGLNVDRLVKLITKPTEDFFQQAALGYSGSVDIDTAAATSKTTDSLKQAAQAISALTQIDEDGAIKGYLPEVKKALQTLPLIWIEAAKQTTAEMTGGAPFDATHVRLPTAMPFSKYQAGVAEAEAFFGTDSSRSKGLKAITELIARGVSSFDIGRILKDELKITDVLPKSTNWPNLIESMGFAKRGLEAEDTITKFLEADGWRVLRVEGKTEQETSLGGISGHPDVIGWHPEFGTRIIDDKFYGPKNMAILEAGGTPEGAKYQTGGYGLSLTPEARAHVAGLAIATPKLDELTGAIIGATVHLRDFDAAVEKQIATTVAAATGKPVTALPDKTFSDRVIAFTTAVSGGMKIASSGRYDPAELIRATANEAINGLFTKYISGAKVEGVSGIDRLIRDTARVNLGELPSDRASRPVIDQLSVLALQLGTSLEQLVMSVVDAKAAIDKTSLIGADKAAAFEKQLTTNLVGGTAPSADARQYVGQKLLEYQAAIAKMQGTSEAAKQYSATIRGKGPSGPEVEVLDKSEPAAQGFETPYSAEMAAIKVKESVYGKSFETLQSRAEAARKEVERVVKLMGTSVGSTFLSGPEKQFNEFTKHMQQLIAQIEYLDKQAMSQKNKVVEWSAIAASTKFELQNKSLPKEERAALEGELENALLNRERAKVREAAILGEANKLRGGLVDMAHSTEYKAWAESDVAKPVKIVTKENIASAVQDVKNAKTAIQQELERDYVRIRAQLYVEPEEVKHVKAAIQQSLAAAKAGVTSSFSAGELLHRLGGVSAAPLNEINQSSSIAAVLQAEQVAKLKGEDSLAALTGPRDAMKQAVKALQVELAALGSTTAVTKVGQQVSDLDKELQQGIQHVKLLNAGIAEISKLPDFDKDGKAYNDLLAKRDKLLSDLLAKEKQMRDLAGQFKVDFFSPDALERAKVDAKEKEAQRLERLKQEKVMLDATLATSADKDALRRNYKLTQQLESELGGLPSHLTPSSAVAAQARSQGIEVGEKGRHAKDFAGQIIDLSVWQVQWAIAGQITALAAAIPAAVGAAREFDKEMTAVRWIMQASTAEAKQLEDSVFELSRTFAFSPTELSQGLIILGQAGFKAVEAMQMLPGVAALATATMSTLAQSTDILTTTIESFNLPTDSSDQIANTLAAITIESKLDLEKLGTTLNYVASSAATTGLSLEDTGTAMGLMANAGVRASTIGTSLRSVLGSLLAPTADFKNELAKVGLTVEEVNPLYHDFGDILRTLHGAGFDTEKAFASLDKRIANGIVVLMEQSAQWDEFQGRITGTQRAFTGAEAQMETFDAQLKRVGSSLNLIGASVFLPAVESGADFLKIIGDITSAAANMTHTLTSGPLGDVSKPVLSIMAITAAVSTLASVVSGLKMGFGSIYTEAKKAKDPTPLQNSLLTMRATFFDPSMLKWSAAAAVAATAATMGYDYLSGEAGHRSAVRERDYTASTLSSLTTYKSQLDKVAPGGMQETMIKDNVIQLAESISMFYDEVAEIVKPLKDDIGAIDAAITKLKVLKAKQEKEVIKAEVEKATGAGATAFNWLGRTARYAISPETLHWFASGQGKAAPAMSFDETDKQRFTAQAEKFASILKSQGKFYAEDETFMAGVEDLQLKAGPEAAEIKTRLEKLREDAMAEPDVVKKIAAAARNRMLRAMTDLENQRANLRLVAKEGDPTKTVGALQEVTAANSELQDAASKYLNTKAEAENNMYVYSIDGLRKNLDKRMQALQKFSEQMNDSQQPEGVREYAKEQFDALMPAAMNKLRSFLVKSFYAKLGRNVTAVQGAMADQLSHVVAYGGEENVAATAVVPISLRGDMLEGLTKLKDKFLQRWHAAGETLQKDPAFKKALLAEYKLEITDNLDDVRKKAAERADRYYKTMQEAWDKVSEQRVINLGLNFDKRDQQRQDFKENALLALRQGPFNLADYMSSSTSGGYGPSTDYVPIAAYSKEQETLVELAVQQASTLDSMRTKADQYAEAMKANVAKLEETRAHYKNVYGGLVTGDAAMKLNSEEQRILDARSKLQQDYLKNLQDALKKEYDLRKQAADTIISLERQKNESMAGLTIVVDSISGMKRAKTGQDLLNDVSATWRAMSDAKAQGNTQGVADSVKLLQDLIKKIEESSDFSMSQKENLGTGLFSRLKGEAGTAWDSSIGAAKDQFSASEAAIGRLKQQRKEEWDKLMGRPASYGTVTDVLTGRNENFYQPGVKGTITEAQRVQFEAQGMTEEKYINAIDAINLDPKTIEGAVNIAAQNLDTLANQFKTSTELFVEATELLKKSLADKAKDLPTMSAHGSDYKSFKDANGAPLQNLALKVDGQIKLIGADGKGVAMSEEQLKVVADRVSYELVKQLNSVGG